MEFQVELPEVAEQLPPQLVLGDSVESVGSAEVLGDSGYVLLLPDLDYCRLVFANFDLNAYQNFWDPSSLTQTPFVQERWRLELFELLRVVAFSSSDFLLPNLSLVSLGVDLAHALDSLSVASDLRLLRVAGLALGPRALLERGTSLDKLWLEGAVLLELQLAVGGKLLCSPLVAPLVPASVHQASY